MPGPGPHTIYTLSTGIGLLHLSGGRFSPHHCLVYAINAFLGPDLGSFFEWLSSTLGVGRGVASAVMSLVHHPFYYVLLLGLPLAFFYRWLSKVWLDTGILDSVVGVPLSLKQAILLIAAGCLSHFFLDHLFEENGHSSMYTWIISTGWWKGHAQNNPEAVVVVGLLYSLLIGGFIYIHRLKPGKFITLRVNQSAPLIILVTSLYCVWCVSQIYWRNPPQPAVGEEADLGVLIFLLIYFFLPHTLCIISMHSKERVDFAGQIPL